MPSQASAFASRCRFQRGTFALVALFTASFSPIFAQIDPEDLPEELKLEAAEIQRVNSIIIPEIAANQTPLVSFLRDIEEKAKKFDKTGRGLRLAIAPNVEKSLEGRVVTWKAKDVPAPNAMQLATYLSWVNARIQGDVFEVVGPMTAIKTWEGADGEMHDEATLAALRNRIVPKIEWKDVAIPTAFEGLSQLSRDPDNGAKAVKFEFAATVPKEFKENVLTLNLHWVPLLEALGYICNLSNLDYKILPGRVEFVVAKPQEEMSPAEMKKSLMKMDGGPGSEAEKTRLSKLILKRVQYKDAKVLDVLAGIVDASRNDDPTGKGVKLVYFLVGPKDKELRLSLDLTDAPMTKVLDAIAEVPELFYVIEGNQVKISPVKAGENGTEVLYPGQKEAK